MSIVNCTKIDVINFCFCSFLERR